MSKIAVIGIGLMGKALVKRLSDTGYQAIAYNRTLEKLTSLETDGVEITTDIRKALENSDCTLVMLSDAEAISSVLLSQRAYLENKVIIQMGTISPQQSRNIHEVIVTAGGEYLEAPVLGSIPEVKTGKLLIMVGGSEAQYQRWLPLFSHLGTDPRYIGEVGTAAAMKLSLNQLIASLTTAFALSLSFVEHQGVDIGQFMSILRQSALYAPTFDKKLSRMLERSYANPNFPTKHLLKDVNLFIRDAETLNINTEALQGIRSILEKATDLGLADSDYSALFSAIDSV